MKGLILCAGKGTRLQPLSLSLPKPLLPVANKPILHYIIEKLVETGISDIGIVINESQEAHFKEKCGFGQQWEANITYIHQNNPLGLAHAVKTAESFIRNDSFLLLLGDNLISESLGELTDVIIQRKGNACILLTRVNNPQDYGVAEIKGETIVRLVEKPRFPKSNFAILGAYAFDSTIFQAIHAISPSARGEYEMTDALQWLIQNNFKVVHRVTKRPTSDVGTAERWLEANRWMLKQFMSENQFSVNRHGNYDNSQIIPPVIIGQNCELKNCKIGPFVSIGAHSIIRNCQIENSIILENVRISKIPYLIKDSIFGRNSSIVGNSKRFRAMECIFGDKASLKLNKPARMKQQHKGEKP